MSTGFEPVCEIHNGLAIHHLRPLGQDINKTTTGVEPATLNFVDLHSSNWVTPSKRDTGNRIQTWATQKPHTTIILYPQKTGWWTSNTSHECLSVDETSMEKCKFVAEIIQDTRGGIWTHE